MRNFSILTAFLLAVCAGPQTMIVAPVHAQAASSLATAPLTHLVIVVPDIKKAAKGYADLWGMDTPPEISKLEYQLANGKKEKVKVGYVPLPNFYLQIIQPDSKNGLLGTHLKKYGLGVWALGIGVDANVDAVREELVAKGGKWTVGRKGGAYAAVDFRETPLGTTLFIGSSARPAAVQAAATEQKGLFGGLRINHIGLANSDAAASVKMYADVLGLKPAEPRRFPPEGAFPYPPAMPWTKNGWVLTSMMFSTNKIGIENIQGMGGPNPWDHHIQHHGGVSIMHIAVGRGKFSHEEWLRVGQEKGGKWTNGGPPPQKLAFAYLDWSDTLGLVIE